MASHCSKAAVEAREARTKPYCGGKRSRAETARAVTVGRGWPRRRDVAVVAAVGNERAARATAGPGRLMGSAVAVPMGPAAAGREQARAVWRAAIIVGCRSEEREKRARHPT
jgi:hypothetical protein